MKKLTAVCVLIILSSCHKEKTSIDQSTGQQDGQSPTQIQSKGIWPFVKDNYWAYRDSTFTSDGTLIGASLNDTLKLVDSINYNSKTYYGPDRIFATYYRQEDNDSIVEYYDSHFKKTRIFFQEADTNNSIIYKNESDQTIYLNGSNRSYHIINELIGYTDFTKVNGYDSCVKNEVVQTYSGDTVFKRIMYAKPGVGMVKMVVYEMKDETPGNLYLYFKRDLLGYKLF